MSFVLVGSLERLQERGLTGTGLGLTFYIRRFFRIYPLAGVVILLIPIVRMPAGRSVRFIGLARKAFLPTLV
jgi:peptidoglycan/LPS O-acetylase OafA/YrhL